MATLVQRGTILAVTTIGAALLALGACVPRDEENEIANLDNQIVNTVDPAVNRAIQDEIAVDPELSNNSNRNAVRTPGSPDTGSYPAEDAQVAGGAGGAGGGASGSARLADAGVGCAQGLDRNPLWAQRLPAAFAVYPGGRLTEAAGKDAGGCSVRVVTFLTGASPRQVLDFYRGRAEGAGYSAEYQARQGDHILAGSVANRPDAFFLIVTPQRGGGSDVALISNAGA